MTYIRHQWWVPLSHVRLKAEVEEVVIMRLGGQRLRLARPWRRFAKLACSVSACTYPKPQPLPPHRTRMLAAQARRELLVAVVANERSFSYSDLLQAKSVIATWLLSSIAGVGIPGPAAEYGQSAMPRAAMLNRAGGAGGRSRNVKSEYAHQCRVALLCENDALYVASLFAVWSAGCIAVPLCKTHPIQEMLYVLRDSGAAVVMSSPEFAEKGKELTDKCSLAHLCLSDPFGVNQSTSSIPGTPLFPTNAADSGAMIVYTSGTTSKPKGVLLSHGNIRAQVAMLLKAWEMTERDVMLHTLPLHHLHGIINALLCPLSVGATVVMHSKFQPDKVWGSLVNEDLSLPPTTVFTGVPTMYAKLLQYYNEAGHCSATKERIKTICLDNVRLMMSGSAALPEPLYHRWREATGHSLLERYGMTEFGMALSHTYHGDRTPGTVGLPLPTVETRIIGDDNSSSTTGELQVRGPAVFHGYWGKMEMTKASFTEDGWFRTGDTVSCSDGSYRILGRTSVDIIKCGGYKISALEVERVLLECAGIVDVAVIGWPDDVWGEKIVAAVLISPQSKVSPEALREWCQPRLAPYKIPSIVKIVDALPHNVMGKVNKMTLKRLLYIS